MSLSILMTEVFCGEIEYHMEGMPKAIAADR
jgi:hypothetical protein